MLLKPNQKKGRNKIEVDNCRPQIAAGNFSTSILFLPFFRFGFNSPGYYFSKISICRPTTNTGAVRILKRKSEINEKSTITGCQHMSILPMVSTQKKSKISASNVFFIFLLFLFFVGDFISMGFGDLFWVGWTRESLHFLSGGRGE